MNQTFLEIAFWAGRATKGTSLGLLLSIAMVLLIFRMMLWIILVILDMRKKYGMPDGWYQYDPQGESVAPDIVRAARNRKKWRVSRWTWWCAWALLVAMTMLALYVVSAIGG